MKQMRWAICKFIVNKQPLLSIDWNYKPIEFIDADIYEIEYKMCHHFIGVDLAKESDKCVVVRTEV